MPSCFLPTNNGSRKSGFFVLRSIQALLPNTFMLSPRDAAVTAAENWQSGLPSIRAALGN